MLILLAFFVQMALGLFLRPGAVKPNLMIIVTIFLALFTDERFGAKAGALSGMLLDIFSIRFFGLNTILFAFGGYLVGKYNSKFYKNSIITHFIVTFAASLAILLPGFLIVNLSDPPESQRLLNLILSPAVLAASLLNSFLSILLYAFLSRMFGLCEREL